MSSIFFFFFYLPCIKTQELLIGCVSPSLCLCVLLMRTETESGTGGCRGCVCRLGAWGWRGCESLGCKKVHRYLSPSACCLAVMGSCLHAAPKASGSRRVHLPGTSTPVALYVCVFVCVCAYKRGSFALTIHVHVSTQGTLD